MNGMQCSTWYDLAHVLCRPDSAGRFDEVVEDGGVRIIIEPAALMHVIGTTMDFVEDRIKCAIGFRARVLG